MCRWAERLRSAVVDPFADFMRRRYWLAILLFIALFKLGEALAGVMTAPFYLSLGFTRTEVAAVGSVFGLPGSKVLLKRAAARAEAVALQRGAASQSTGLAAGT